VNLDLVHRLGDGDGFIAIGIVDQNHQIRERLRHEFFADNAQRPCRIVRGSATTGCLVVKYLLSISFGFIFRLRNAHNDK
jgi:hypothetical protein